MQQPRAVLALSWLIVVLAFIAAAAGFLWQGGEGPLLADTARGGEVPLYGRGLYRYDSLFIGAGNRGTDFVTLTLGIPLLALFSLLHRRGSLRAGLLLLGTLAYFLYVYASYALGVAYNGLFLVYVALFSASLYAFIRLFLAFDPAALRAHFLPGLLRRAPAFFMFASGLATLAVWLMPLVSAIAHGRPPMLLDVYTTKVTDVLDLGIVTPATFVAGAQMLRRAAMGYLVAISLLMLEIMLAPLITAQTVSQVSAGVRFTPGQIVGPIAGFVVLALIGAWMIVALLRGISECAAGAASVMAGRRADGDDCPFPSTASGNGGR